MVVDLPSPLRFRAGPSGHGPVLRRVGVRPAWSIGIQPDEGSRMPMGDDTAHEWLEADGLGGFASGTATGIRTRRYHALLLAATTPPTGRVVLVNGFEAWIEGGGAAVALTSQAYLPDVVHPDGASRITGFHHEPWPRWTFRLPDGETVEQEIVAVHGAAAVVVRWRASGPTPGVLCVRPLLSGRDYHALHHENPDFRFTTAQVAGMVVWHPYPGIPRICTRTNGSYVDAPSWYRGFRYDAERERGLEFAEDLASPGVLRFELAAGEAVWMMAAEGHEHVLGPADEAPGAVARRVWAAEQTRRAAFVSPLHRAAEAYVVRRGAGNTLVAGYPWFTDWGRDTFIAMRGLCLAPGRLALARDILLEWSSALADGMLPNRFPDHGETPEFNSVDASLWYVLVVEELLAAPAVDEIVSAAARARLSETVEAVLDGYARGARHGIRLDDDGLLAAGEPGVQLTWMDAKVGDWVVTPRIGKPVEVQALWLNALGMAGGRSPRWREVHARGRASFAARFWDETRGCLHDVVDVDHQPGTVDPSFRPNQIFAAGGLPESLLAPAQARRVVDEVERRLWTPLGLRSLAPGEPGYVPHYQGGVRERDGAYHQGTVWPWLLGPFVEAWVRARGGRAGARREARARFLAPLQRHLETAGLGHVSEIADAEPPHTPRGCPFQAWSVGEALRLALAVLDEGTLAATRPRPTPAGRRSGRRVPKGDVR
jgi:predicted glycogen debranching enzyme